MRTIGTIIGRTKRIIGKTFKNKEKRIISLVVDWACSVCQSGVLGFISLTHYVMHTGTVQAPCRSVLQPAVQPSNTGAEV